MFLTILDIMRDRQPNQPTNQPANQQMDDMRQVMLPIIILHYFCKFSIEIVNAESKNPSLKRISFFDLCSLTIKIHHHSPFKSHIFGLGLILKFSHLSKKIPKMRMRYFTFVKFSI